MASFSPAVGSNVPKKEAADKVTGRALYVDDLTRPGMLYGATIRSSIAAGRIRRVVFDAAHDWSDVTVADYRDIPGENTIALIEHDQPCLAADRVRHREEPILLLAHPDREKLLAAARAITIEYEPERAVFDVQEALRAETVIHPPDNILKRITIARGDVDAALADAPVVVEGVYEVGHQEHVYIETNGALAWVDENGTLCIVGSLQCPYYVQKALVCLFNLPPEKVRIIQAATGGGFGGKEEYPSMIAAHAALLAWKSGRPVKIVYDRMEDIAATTKRHPAVVRHRTGVTAGGRLLAQDIDVVMDGGAYVTLSPVVLSRGALHAAGPYRCDNVRVGARAVATNTPPNGAFRGFGAPQTLFAAEMHMERIARTLGIDSVVLRERNLYRAGDVMPTGQVLDEGVAAADVLEAALARSRYHERRRAIHAANAAAIERWTRADDAFAGGRASAHATPGARAHATDRAPDGTPAPSAAAARATASRATRRTQPGRPGGAAGEPRVLRGIGLSLVMHGSGFTGSGEMMLASIASVDLRPDGVPRVLAASTEIGQGTSTIFAQMAADALGVSYDLVDVANPDTAAVPNSGPTVASRTCMVVGGLVASAAEEMAAHLRAFDPRGWRDDAEFVRVARAYIAAHGPIRVNKQYAPPPGVVWDDATYTGAAYATYAWAATVVEVEVDADTYDVRPVHVAVAAEIGKAVHPRLVEGQIEGGLVQALGWALLEEVRWKDGGIWNQQLTNYIIPTAMDSPPIDVVLIERPYRHGAYGAKGVGELPMDCAAPAVIAAIADATGVLLPRLPASPERVAEALVDPAREMAWS
jgi:CO/xanthine dehydrogenase Mo-binding subunit